MPLWFWLRKGSMRKSLQVRSAARNGSAYGQQYRRDQVKPTRTEILTGKGFTWAEIENLQAIANTPSDAPDDAGKLVAVDHLGNTWKGPISSLSWDPRGNGGTIYWDVSVELDNPEFVPPEEPEP